MRRILCAFTLVLLILLSALPAIAMEPVDASIKVHDFMDVLTDSEIDQLNQKALAFVNAYDIDIAIVVVDGLEGKSAKLYAADLYEASGYGVGSGADGMMLLVSLGERDMAIVTHGKAIRMLSDSDREKLFDRFTSQMSSGNYYTAFSRFLSGSETYMAAGQPLRKRVPIPVILLVSIAVGAAVSFIVMAIIKFNHKRSLTPPNDAAGYLAGDNGFVVTRKVDQFQHTHTSRTPIPKSTTSSGGGGGSSTFRSSSGGSFGGGSRKF